jgi:hypothetical protein
MRGESLLLNPESNPKILLRNGAQGGVVAALSAQSSHGVY